MTEFIEKVHASPMWDDKQEMLIPGEIEYRTMRKRKAEGIPLPPALVDELTSLAVEMGVQVDLKQR